MESESVQKNMNGKSQGMAQTSKVVEPQMPVEEESEKMPILKKWWFWAAIGGAVIILGLILFFLL